VDEVIVEIFEMSLVAEQNDLVDFLFVRKEKNVNLIWWGQHLRVTLVGMAEAQKNRQETELDKASETCPCVKGCGYYGTSSTLNMCSKCYREHQRQEQQGQMESVGPQHQLQEESLDKAEDRLQNTTDLKHVDLQQGTCVSEAITGQSELQLEDNAGASLDANSRTSFSPCQAPERKSNRCHYCQKKVGLTGFTCRCGRLFCSDHRYSDKHDCTFDYKAENKEMLARSNPQVFSAKLNKI
jgi:hypothetical protein